MLLPMLLPLLLPLLLPMLLPMLLPLRQPARRPPLGAPRRGDPLAADARDRGGDDDQTQEGPAQHDSLGGAVGVGRRQQWHMLPLPAEEQRRVVLGHE